MPDNRMGIFALLVGIVALILAILAWLKKPPASLNDLTDVEITTPVECHTLHYQDGKWKNKPMPSPPEGEYSSYEKITVMNLNTDTLLVALPENEYGSHFLTHIYAFHGDIFYGYWHELATGMGTVLKIDLNTLTAERIALNQVNPAGADAYLVWNPLSNPVLGKSQLGKYVAGYEDPSQEGAPYNLEDARCRIWKENTLIQTIISSGTPDCPPKGSGGGVSVVLSPTGKWLLIFSKGCGVTPPPNTVHRLWVYRGVS